MSITPAEARQLEGLGRKAVRAAVTADMRLRQAAADLRAGRIRTREYNAADRAARVARREAGKVLTRIRRTSG